MNFRARLRRFAMTARQGIVRLMRSYVTYHAYAKHKLRYAALIGFVSFPSFWVIWTYGVPQPYEDAVLRAIGAVLCLAVALADSWPLAIRRYKAVVSYFTVVYCLPFFFTFMLLMNDGNEVWLLSTLAASVYVVFLVDSRNIFPIILTGALLGWLHYLSVAANPAFPPSLYVALPILIYTFTGIAMLNHSSNTIAEENLKAAKTLAGYIAHEMRTPLAAIQLDAQTADTMIRNLAEAYRFAVSNGYQGVGYRPEKIALLSEMCRRVVSQTISANLVIDALLLNIAGGRSVRGNVGLHQMKTTINMALESYFFKPEQVARIHVESIEDFTYRGSEDLMRHVIFNLLRNALRATEANEGQIWVILSHKGSSNVVTVADNGVGIPHDLDGDLFTPFRSLNRDSGGSGLGLAFCRIVIEAMDGTISYTTKRQAGTSFTIQLPAVSQRGDDA
jgi:two-component system, CAI-1 autoinducer sensor kinase/phosphatase CqsS